MDKETLAGGAGKSFLYGIIGGLAGVLVGVFVAGNAVNNRNYGMMGMMGMGQGMMQMRKGDTCPMMGQEKKIDGMGMSMSQMSLRLKTLRDDEFDKEFMELMTEHHQGAIDMARLVLTNTERSELKEMANDIISAQSKEIEMMRNWNKGWFGGE